MFFLSFLWLVCGLIVAPPAAGQVHFVDATQEAGIDFNYSHGGTGQKYFIETMGPGCMFLDYDGDGFLDLYALNGHTLDRESEPEQTNRLFRNNGDGTFADRSRQAGVADKGYGVGTTAADYDNDGDIDIYIANYGANVLLRNEEGGTFVDVTDQAGVSNDAWSTGCAFLDYDNDGSLDLYVVNYVEYRLDMPVKDLTPYVIAAQTADAREGPLRAYPSPDNFEGSADGLYRNRGDGTFADVTARAGVANPTGKGMGLVGGDYDNDGDVDIFVANDQTPNFLYQNKGDGTFVDVALIAGVGYSGHGKMEASMGADFGDYNNDGLLDLVVSNFQREPTSLFRNEGHGLFWDESIRSGIGSPSLAYVGWGTAFFDYDNDGLLDIFVANGHTLDNIQLFDTAASYEQPNQLFRNVGEGHFEEVSAVSGEILTSARVSRGAAFGDYDNDGDVDIFVVHSVGRADLLRNDGGNQKNWLQVQVLGVDSNREGIGVRLELNADGLRQIREIKTGSGLYSQNDLRASFGLGKSEIIELLEVRWPSGKVDRIPRLPVNQRILVKEGVGLIDTGAGTEPQRGIK